MPRKKLKKEDKTQWQIASIFLFFLLLRVFVLFFYSHPTSRYLDIMSVFVVFTITRMRLSGASLLFWAWAAGLAEDLFSGGVLGINAISKVTIAEFANIMGRKVEIGNIAFQIPAAMLLFAMDVLIKHLIITAVTGNVLSEQFLWTIMTIKVSASTIAFLLVCAVFR